jgi:hypothetical protein
MCVTVYKYLVWPDRDFQPNAIPIASSTQGYLMKSGFEVKNKAVLKFPVVDQPGIDCTKDSNGMIYYNSQGKFLCCAWDSKLSKYNWLDCGGVSGGWSGNEFTAPVTIWRDANKTFKVLEISE